MLSGGSGALKKLASKSELYEDCGDLFLIKLEVRFGMTMC